MALQNVAKSDRIKGKLYVGGGAGAVLFRIAQFISENIVPEIIAGVVVAGLGWLIHSLAENKKALIGSCCAIASVLAVVLVWYFYTETADSGQSGAATPTSNEPQIQTIHYFLGDRYEGEVVNRKPNGQGIKYYTSGDRYEDEWKDGKANGQGVYYWADGGRSEGEWKDGKRNGQGVWYGANGDRYEGEWKDNKRNGQGVYYYANGDRYEGEYKDDKRNGQGVFYYADGRSENQEWKDGERVS